MSINYRRASECLKAFDFRRLFVEFLGWGHPGGRATTLVANELRYRATPIAELASMVVFTVEPLGDAPFPTTNIQKRMERDLGKLAHEHLIIYLDANKTKATWLWVKRGIHTTAKDRRHTYQRGQPGDALLHKLAGIVFRSEDFDAEGRAAIVEVTKRIEKSFDVERVTKRFFEDFKTEHKKFLEAIDGIDDGDDHSWYTSVMLNRVMFIYFIQYKNLLDNDPQYLAHKLAASKKAGANRFYREFLTTLFFEGFAHEEGQRSPETRRLVGRIPYLNGGLFNRHQIEENADNRIDIPDRAFERLFEFFDGWDWVLEPRSPEYYIEHPTAKEEINPDVLGYIFEKYINQKEMGAYYTKEDITGYISRGTVLPFLIDKLGSLRYNAVHPLPIKEIDPYIYPAVLQEEYLPTETGREYAARRKRLMQIRADFAAGKLEAINDFITFNLDIEAFVQDFLEGLTDPLTLRAFYFECLKKLTVLDPTVGSGAFLFAVMNILEPLYEICLDKMEELADINYPDFAGELKRIAEHPNRAYFIFKTIIVNNLYGVDILEEGTEICKLRLFLKLIAQVERDDTKPNFGIEPLPDIDFNIRAGNTLVGYASLGEIEQASKRSLFALNLPQQIRESDAAIRKYRVLQTQLGIGARELAQAKKQTTKRLGEIENALNQSLSAEYGARSVDRFVKSHQPFHWYVEFNQIMQDGGFDVIVGNPPYVEYSKVRKKYILKGFECIESGNLYAYVIERSLRLQQQDSRIGMIIQLSAFCTPRMESFQNVLFGKLATMHLAFFDDRPGKLFDGLQHIRVAIVIGRVGTRNSLTATTRYIKFATEFRPYLFQTIYMQANEQPRHGSSVLKISEPFENSIARKLWKSQTTLGGFLEEGENKNYVYYGYGFGYWGKILNFKSYFKGEKVTASTGDKYIYCVDRLDRDIVVATMNSSLFYWFYVIYSDGHNFTKHVIGSFPFTIPNQMIAKDLKRLCLELMNELKASSRKRHASYAATGQVEYDEFYPRLSKPIIDEIDGALAAHYGFTDEELDFIINYDIKYRMGKNEGEEEE